MYQKVHSINLHDRVLSVDYSSSTHNLFSISSGKTVNLIPNNLKDEGGNQINPKYSILSRGDIIQSKFSSNGKYFCISDMEQGIVIYDIENSCQILYKSESQLLLKNYKFKYSPNSEYLINGSYNINLIDIKNKKSIASQIEGHYYYSYEFINDNSFAAGNINGNIYIYSIDFESKSIKKELKFEENSKLIRSLFFNSKNNKLFSASDDFHINIFDMESKKIEYSFIGHSDLITNLDFIVSKSLIVSSSLDGKIKFWDIRSMKEVDILNIGSSIWDFSLSKDNQKNILIGTDNSCEFYRS